MEYIVNTRNSKTIDILEKTKEKSKVATYYIESNKMMYYDALENPLLFTEIMDFIRGKIETEESTDEPS